MADEEYTLSEVEDLHRTDGLPSLRCLSVTDRNGKSVYLNVDPSGIRPGIPFFVSTSEERVGGIPFVIDEDGNLSLVRSDVPGPPSILSDKTLKEAVCKLLKC